MTKWDRKLLSKLKSVGIKIELYKRYVDDVVLIAKAIEPGWYLDAKARKRAYSEGHRDSNLAVDERTMKIITEAANTMDENIQIEYDCPTKNGNGCLPVLDLSIWMEDNKVQWGFYSKRMASPFSIMYSSALPQKSKRETLLQRG